MKKIVMLTAYSYPLAKIIDGIVDIVLVGDSVANVVYGYDTTRKVDMDDMIKHVAAVKRGIKKSMVVADMPYKSEINKKTALKNAKLFLKAGADAVKVEGKPEIVAYLVKNKIKVMGHGGLLPQSTKNFKVKGRDEKQAKIIFDQAVEIEKAGAFAIVLELISSRLAKKISKKLKIPTIGIGAGKDCDGQVLVAHDMLGFFDNFTYKFAKKYADLSKITKKAVSQYASEVRKGKFPTKKYSFR